MTRRHMVGWLAVFVSVGLAILGFLVFIFGVLSELLFASGPQSDIVSISPVTQVALAGLCLAALMVTLGFGLVAFLLARQTRQQGAGYGDAYRLIENFQFDEAIPLLEKTIADGRETSETLMLLTSAYAYSGQLARAQATADRAVRLFPDEPGAYVTLANGYRLQASYDEAARALQKAAELAPDQPVIWAELGLVQQIAGHDEDAFSAFRRAAEHSLPAMYGVRVYYHLMLAYQQADEAQQAARAAAKMVSARRGLDAWRPVVGAFEGTAYGQVLRYEIAGIEQALQEADAAHIG